MAGRLTMINEDPRFAEPIQAQPPILDAARRAGFLCLVLGRFRAGDRGTVDSRRRLLAEAVEATYLVQAARLQEWPVTLLVVEQTPALDASRPARRRPLPLAGGCIPADRLGPRWVRRQGLRGSRANRRSANKSVPGCCARPPRFCPGPTTWCWRRPTTWQCC
jgi:hypothetical protein